MRGKDRTAAYDEARRLVVAEGYTYEEAAEATGIPASTLQKRGCAENWMDQRAHSMSYAASIRALKVKLLEKATASRDPQDVFAWRQVETAWPEHRYQPAQADPRARLALVLELLDELVNYLAEQAPDALAALRPHIAPFSAHLERGAA
jgi:hypothetical protein